MAKKRPDQLPAALIFVLVGIHYQRFTFEDLIPDVDRRLTLLQAAEQGVKVEANPLFQGQGAQVTAA